MRPEFQSKQSVIINAPIKNVWEFSQDLSRIAEYHPRVNQVELISGNQFREAGASYKCHLSDGKNNCIEKDIEIIPMEKIVTIPPSDTMGLTKLMPDYLVETTFKGLDEKNSGGNFTFLFQFKLEGVVIKFYYKEKSGPGDPGHHKCSQKED